MLAYLKGRCFIRQHKGKHHLHTQEQRMEVPYNGWAFKQFDVVSWCNAGIKDLRIFLNMVSRILRIFLSVCSRKDATNWQEYPRMASWHRSSFCTSFNIKIALEISPSVTSSCISKGQLYMASIKSPFIR